MARKPTSINVDEELYQKLKLDLLGRGISYSNWFEDCMRHWLSKGEMPRPSSPEKQVIEALRKLVDKEKSLMAFLPPLLGITNETLEAFRDRHS